MPSVEVRRLIADTMRNPSKRQPGIEFDVPRAIYDEITRLNPSSIAPGLMSRGEVDALAIRDAFEGERSFTPAVQDRLDRGSLSHLLLLQPELVRERVAIWPGQRRASAEWDKFEADNAGKLIVRQKDYDEVLLATSKLLEVPKVREMFAGVRTEVAIFGEEGTGKNTVYGKGLVDALKIDSSLATILDLKTTEAGIDAQSVKRTIRALFYREKMALYRRWYCQATQTDPEIVKCVLVFARLSHPVAVRIVRLSTAALQWGESRMLRAIDSVRACIHADNWPVFVGDDVADVDQWEEDEEETDYAS